MKPEEVKFEICVAGMLAWDEAVRAASAKGEKTPTWPAMMAIAFAAMTNEAEKNGVRRTEV